MKSSIAGIFLAGSLLLPQYAGVKSSTDARDEIANISGKFKAENKELIAKVLKNGDMTKSTNTLSAQSSAAGDLFLELVPENEYGNIEKEKVAISKLISGLKSVERLSLKGMSHQDRIALHTGISDLIAQYDSVNQKTFDRKTFEDRTYVALLNLVILFDVDSLSELRRIIDPEKIKIINAAYSPAANSMQWENLIRVGTSNTLGKSQETMMLEQYVSLFQAELVYLENNPELLASCGARNPKRNELRQQAIILVQRIIATTVTDPNLPSTKEHETYREQLFNVRKKLYPKGEMGYVDAQEWGYRELMRWAQKSHVSL